MANNDPQIKIGVGVDGAGITVAERLIDSFFKRIGGKAGETGKVVKELFGLVSSGGAGAGGAAGAAGGMGLLGTAAAFGAIAGAAVLLGQLARSTARWADEIKDTATELNISTDAVQGLAFAAELMGKDLQWAASMMEKEELFLEKALGGQEKFAKIAREMGLSSEQLTHLNPEAMHEKFIKAVMAHTISDAEIGRIYGAKNIRAIKTLGENEEYAKKYGIKVDASTVAAMADEWKVWKTIFKDLGVVLLYVGAILVAAVRIIRKSFMAIFDIIVAAVAGLVAGVLKIISLIPGFGFAKKEATAAWKGAKEYATAAGQNMVEIVKPAGSGGEVSATNREPDFGANKGMASLPENPFLKIGGLAGVDTNFRIERLTQKMADHLANIDENTKPKPVGEAAKPPTESSVPNYSGIGAINTFMF